MTGRPPAKSVLTAREIEILALVADGHTNQQIGTALGLAHTTVKSHLSRIGLKLGNGDRAGMVGVGFRRGYLR